MGARVVIMGHPLGTGVKGTIRFKGPTKFEPGTWLGIELDTPGNHFSYPILSISIYL